MGGISPGKIISRNVLSYSELDDIDSPFFGQIYLNKGEEEHKSWKEGNMAKVAREMVERSGVNIDQLLELLVANAAAELTTFYYYTILRVNLIGLEGEGLKVIAEDARIEDRNHFEALVPRIYELGGKIPDDMKVFHDLSA